MKHAKRLLIYLYTARENGWIFMYNGSAISWRSVQQNCVALSTTKAYMAASDAATEGRSLLKLANNIFNKQVQSISIGEDNRTVENWT